MRRFNWCLVMIPLGTLEQKPGAGDRARRAGSKKFRDLRIKIINGLSWQPNKAKVVVHSILMLFYAFMSICNFPSAPCRQSSRRS